MNQQQPGSWVISLDFELLWGIFDKSDNKVNSPYFQHTRDLVPGMLEMFANHEIEATWATVGMLFAENEEEWKTYSPELKPTYREKSYSAYEWVKQNGITPTYHFAPELIKLILETPGQELGSHSFAHYYTLLRGQTPEQWRMDLRAAQLIAMDKFQVQLRSLVFPRNHFNLQYLKICKEEGFTQVRSNPVDWFWQETQNESILKKISRTADCYVRIGERSSYSIGTIFQESENHPIEIPASRLLRSFNAKSRLLNSWRLNRVKNEMTVAAKKQEVYHLWWHPHNFANNPSASLAELESLIQHFKTLRDKYGMQSHSMQSLVDPLNPQFTY